MSRSENPNNLERALSEMRDELERDLLHPKRAGVKARGFGTPRSWLPRRILPFIAGAAIAAGGAGIAVAASGIGETVGEGPGIEPPAELLGITSDSGERIDFKCEADRQWFFDHIDGSGDLPLENLPDPLPVPPEGICEGSPKL